MDSRGHRRSARQLPYQRKRRTKLSVEVTLQEKKTTEEAGTEFDLLVSNINCKNKKTREHKKIIMRVLERIYDYTALYHFLSPLSPPPHEPLLIRSLFFCPLPLSTHVMRHLSKRHAYNFSLPLRSSIFSPLPPSPPFEMDATPLPPSLHHPLLAAPTNPPFFREK